MTRVIILLGAPGAGKGTQAVRLSQALGLPHVSTGDLFRENISQGTTLGERAQSYLESGRLVPDDLTVDMLFDRTSRSDCANGYMLDGFPRTVPQAVALGERLGDDASLTVLNIQVPDEIIVDRSAGRLLCRACGNIQHKSFSPPAQEGVCDACSGELYQRKDDQPDVVQDRLGVYHAQTEPLVGHYGDQGVCLSVDGNRAPDEVFAGCLASLEVEA
ncbi:MAG: adenylate kinase [Planctomycetota bacterium]|nr:adenylate kinase [Planctomycetota bacterium]